MGIITDFNKWDLEKGQWIAPNPSQYGRSFAFANYENIINDPSKNINYIIISAGTRVEDHTKKFQEIKENKVRIDYVLDYLKHKKENYCVMLYLMDADAPIIEDAKLFAEYIDGLSILPTTNSINLINLSKCSAMNFYVPRFFQNEISFKKTNMYNIASPYAGTKMASPAIFYPEVEKLVHGKINNNLLANFVYNNLIKIYESVSSNSHMDYDIAIPGGVFDEKKDVYDENFIKNIFSEENITSIKQLNTFKNLITGIDGNTLDEAIKTKNFTGIGLYLLDKAFFQEKSDGMVYVFNQRKVEPVLGIESVRLKSTHHAVNTITRSMAEILGIVCDTIDEDDEKKVFYKK